MPPIPLKTANNLHDHPHRTAWILGAAGGSRGGLCFAFDQTPTEQVGCDLSFLHYLCFIFFDDIKLGA